MEFARVRVWGNGQPAPVVSTGVTIGAGNSVALDLARDPVFPLLPSGFVGWMAVDTGDPARHVAVQVYSDGENGRRPPRRRGQEHG